MRRDASRQDARLGEWDDMVINKKRIRPTGNDIPCHTLHLVTVIAGFVDSHVANPTATLGHSRVKTVVMDRPVYPITDQDSAKSGMGPR